MKKLLANFGVFGIVAGLLLWFTNAPWWVMAPLAAIFGFFQPQRPAAAFATGLASGTALWYGVAAWLSWANGGILIGRMAKVFQLTDPSWLFVATGFIGGLLAGLGMMTGSMARDLTTPKRPASRYWFK